MNRTFAAIASICAIFFVLFPASNHGATGLSFDPPNRSVAPGGTVNVDVNLSASAGERAAGATFFLQAQSGPDLTKIQLAGVVPTVAFDQLQTPGATSLAKDLGGFHSALAPTAGTGTNTVSTISLRATPDAPQGDYVFAFISSAAKGAVYADQNLATSSFDSLGTLTVTVSGPVDTDGDTMSDDYENRYPSLFNANAPNDPNLDFDKDGIKDGEEEIYGTSPIESDLNTISIRYVERLTNPDRLRWEYGPVRPGLRYSLRYKLAANPETAWTTIADHAATAEQQTVTVDHNYTLVPGVPIYYQVFLLPMNPQPQ